MDLAREYTHVVVASTAAGAVVVLSTANGSTIIRLHSLQCTLDSTGTFQIQTVTTGSTAELAGTMTYPAFGGPNWPFVPQLDGAYAVGEEGGNLQLKSSVALNGIAIVSRSTD